MKVVEIGYDGIYFKGFSFKNTVTHLSEMNLFSELESRMLQKQEMWVLI
jgi:hypothetical protein